MPRKGHIAKRDVLPDPIYNSKVVTRTMGQFVDGNIGIYKITGNLRLLEILYAAGIGTRRSAGHGKFEIIF